MIPKELTIELHDEKFMKLLSKRGCFPISSISDDIHKDYLTGCAPSSNGEHYKIVDVLKVLGNLKRYNFIELMFGVPVEKEIKHKTLF